MRKRIVGASSAVQHNALMIDKNSPVEDKDAPLKADTRLLGRLLGDVIRAQRGDATFEKVESIRQQSVRFHREEIGRASCRERVLASV